MTVIAITGATGFIGRRLARALSREGHGLVLFGRDEERLAALDLPARLATMGSDGPSVADLAGVRSLVHLAGRRHRDESTLDEYLRDNVVLTDRVLSVCREAGVDRAVLASSVSVYDPDVNTRPFDEGQVCRPRSAVGVSKAAAELVASHHSAMGLPVTALRIGQVVGADERPGFLLRTWFDRARDGQPLELWGPGAGARDYVYADDVVEGIGCALAGEPVVGPVNLSAGVAVTHEELAEAVNLAFGNAGNLTRLPDRPGDPTVLQMSIERARDALGWSPRHDLVAMMAAVAAEPI